VSDTRFVLEQQIFECWHVCDDIKVVYEESFDSEDVMSEDELSNILIGMQQLYNRKFSRLFNTYEKLLKEIRPEVYETDFSGLPKKSWNWDKP
jgi:hypothetical protein